MPESGSNIEIAHRIAERGHHRPPPDRSAELIETFEGIVLAIVALATAWSGYQASKWDGLSAEQYALASRATVLAQEKATLAGQEHLYDITTFNGWMAAKELGNEKAAALYERRFRPEYARAFAAWQKLDPLDDPSAGADASTRPEYANQNALASSTLLKDAGAAFERAVSARETGDQYVKVTVILATVLLLTALGQRFRTHGPRIAVVAIALALLAKGTHALLVLPRLW